MKSNMKIARVLTIAGSDSGGGAGIQADIKAISATGSYAASAITAVTVQNTVGVRDVFPLPINIVTGQIEAVLDDIGADAIKIGMLHSVEVIEAVRTELLKYRVKNLVIDPVMVATSGDRLINEDAVSALKERLFNWIQGGYTQAIRTEQGVQCPLLLHRFWLAGSLSTMPQTRQRIISIVQLLLLPRMAVWVQGTDL